ncbi:radical SAM protein [bacterium]|nr:radical SAM protein [bacterium]
MSEQVLIAFVEEGVSPRLAHWQDVAEGIGRLRAGKIDVRVELIKTVRQREEFVDRLKADPPEILFVPVYREQLHAANALLLKIRNMTLPTVIAVGGPMGTLGSDIFTFNPVPTAIVLGEWQDRLRKFASKLLREGSGSDIPGVWWRGQRGWQINVPERPLTNLDELDDADYTKLPVEDLMKINDRTLPLLASRGCPFSCQFCHVPLLRRLERPETQYRTHSPERIVTHALELVELHNPRRFVFVDELFPWQERWVEKFARLWKEKVALPFRWTTAAEQMSKDNLRLLSGAGGEVLEIGIETGDENRRSEFCDRNLHNRAIVKAVQMAQDYGVKVAANVMLGLPRSDTAELQSTIDFIRELEPDEVRYQFLTPWPRKTNWSETEHEGLELTGISIHGGRATSTQSTLPKRHTKDLMRTMEELRLLDAAGRLRAQRPAPDVALDGMAQWEEAKWRSQLNGPLRVERYSAPNGTHDVLALRVPTEISWELQMPEDPILEFGILIEPTLPGQRSKSPVSFSVKFEQNERVYRVFQKILIQSLDPDSRKWHWFSIPLRPSHPGPARLILGSSVYGEDASYLPEEGDIWAGWTGIVVRRSG